MEAKTKNKSAQSQKSSRKTLGFTGKLKKMRPDKIVLGFCLLIGLTVFAYAMYGYFSEPWSEPQKVHVTNVTGRSATISWVTEEPTKGYVLYSESSTFAPWIFSRIGKEFSIEDRDVTQARLDAALREQEKAEENDDSEIEYTEIEEDIVIENVGQYYTHHVTVKGLDPEKKYYFKVGNGVRFETVTVSEDSGGAGDNSFTTAAELDEIPVPNPAYGKVMKVQEEQVIVEDAEEGGEPEFDDVNFYKPVTDAVVYLHFEDPTVEENSDSVSEVISAPVASNGSWYMDLNNARNINGEVFLEDVEGKGYLALSENFTIEYGGDGIFETTIGTDEDAPAEDFVVDMPESEVSYLNGQSLVGRVHAIHCPSYGDGSGCYDVDGGCNCPGGWVGHVSCESAAYDCTGSPPAGISGYDDDTNKQWISYCQGLGGGACWNGSEPGCDRGDGCEKICGGRGNWSICEKEVQEPPISSGSQGSSSVTAGCEKGTCTIYGTTYEGDGEWSGKKLDLCSEGQQCGNCTTEPCVCTIGDDTQLIQPGEFCGSSEDAENACESAGGEMRETMVGGVSFTKCGCKDSDEYCDAEYDSDSGTWSYDCSVCSTEKTGEIDYASLCDAARGVMIEEGSGGTYFSRCACSKTSSSNCALVNEVDGRSISPFYDCSGCPDATEMQKSAAEAAWGSSIRPGSLPESGENLFQIMLNAVPWFGDGSGSDSSQAIGEEDFSECTGDDNLIDTPAIANFRVVGTDRWPTTDEVHCNGPEDIGRCISRSGLLGEAIFGCECNSDRKFDWVSPSKYCEDTSGVGQESQRDEDDFTGRQCATTEEKGGKTCNTLKLGRIFVLSSNPYYCTINDNDECILVECENFSCSDQKGNWTKDAGQGSFLGVTSVSAQDSETQQILIDPEKQILLIPEGGGFIFELKDEEYYFEAPGDENQEYKVFVDTNENGHYDEDAEEIVDVDLIESTVQKVKDTSAYELKQGFNFVSFDMVDLDKGTMASEVLDSLNQEYNDSFYSIAKYDSGWVVVGNRDGEGYGETNDFQIVPGRGYVIRAKRDVTVDFYGKRVIDPVPSSLREGWNLMAVHGASEAYTAESLIDAIDSVASLDADNVTRWVEESSKYEGLQKEPDDEGVEQVYGFDFPIQTQSAYFVRIDSGSGEWSPD